VGIEGVGQDSQSYITIAIPQPSLTRREQELHLEEGQPPLEVVSAEQQAVGPQQRGPELARKWRRKKSHGQDRGLASEDAEGECEAAQEGSISPGGLDGRSTEEDKTGTLFDDRS
jgi:hypothetical protein